MDELVIGDKKYVSSKQAAKVTGYAKDYIGQLCREGRVPARLVGRSWYVLETAIHDHRFGEQKSEQEAQEAPDAIPAFPQTWEAPRYSAASVEEELPSVNRLNDAEEGASEGDPVSRHLQDSWKAWFDRVADAAPSIPDVVPEKGEEKEAEPVVKEEEREVSVPIHTVYQQPPEELLPRRFARVEVQEAGEEEYEEEAPRRMGRRVGVAAQIVGAGLALVVALLAVVGSGYFDQYIISNSQVGMVAGVSLYNK